MPLNSLNGTFSLITHNTVWFVYHMTCHDCESLWIEIDTDIAMRWVKPQNLLQ